MTLEDNHGARNGSTGVFPHDGSGLWGAQNRTTHDEYLVLWVLLQVRSGTTKTEVRIQVDRRRMLMATTPLNYDDESSAG